MIRTLLCAALAAVAVAAPAVFAQQRPSEEEIFGTPPQPRTNRKPEKAGNESPRPDEAELFGSQGPASAVPPPPEGIIPRDAEDPLRVGGQVYLRLQGSAYEDLKPRNWPLDSPNLVDVYLDVRPNDRVRGFVLGRMSYDPTLGTSQVNPALADVDLDALGITSGSGDPEVDLDQLWASFDLWRTIFVTAGKQHVKWGVGKYWNPTDYLHPQKRDPLAVFDARLGTALVKLALPWEKRGWNLYGVVLFEDAGGDTGRPTDRVGRIGGGGRAEVVLGNAELGLDALVQDGRKPRFGVDLSAGVLEFDLYTEAALRSGIDGSHWRCTDAERPCNVDEYVRDDPKGLTPQVVVGGSWAYKYSDEDSFTLGAEYFYNDAGYSNSDDYSFLLAGAPLIDTSTDPDTVTIRDTGAFTPFYLGKHYASAYAHLPNPGRWNDTTFTLTLLGNLSDRSFILRLDHSVLVLTYLRIETFVAGHLGKEGGEFRLTIPEDLADAAGIPEGPPVIDVGVAVRVSL